MWKRTNSLFLLSAVMLVGSLLLPSHHSAAEEVSFDYTGGLQSWVVPDGVTSIDVDLRGAQGGTSAPYTSFPGGPGGLGGRVQTTISVTPGETLYVYVGGAGSGGTGGFNGGAVGGSGGGAGGSGGGGGGASDIRRGGTSLTDRIAVAGGGGGGKGYYDQQVDGDYGGGHGGGLVGEDGPSRVGAGQGGGGGTQTSGGAGGSIGTNFSAPGSPGSVGVGGAGGNYSASGVGGGGGGGGYYGGGGGGADSGGGGGGSSYSQGSNTTHTQGFQADNGKVIIETPPQNAAELSKSDRLVSFIEENLDDYAQSLVIDITYVTLLAPACVGPQAVVCTGVGAFLLASGLASNLIHTVQLLQIIHDPPDPNFSTIFIPRDYPPPTVEPAGAFPGKVEELANLALANLTDLYEITEAWRVTLERYNAALAASDANAASVQLQALGRYVAVTSAAAASVKVRLLPLINDLEKLIGPVQVSQDDIEAALANLSQNGFGPEEQEFFSNLGVSQEAINEILNALLALDPSEVPTDLFATFRQAAESYGELADISSSLIPTEIMNLQEGTLAAEIPEPHKETLITFLDRALILVTDGRAALAAGDVKNAKKFFHLARVQIWNYFHHLHSMKSGNRKLPPEVTDPLLAAAKDIIAQIDALLAEL